MIFSSKAEYGVRLMVELGRQSPEHPTSLKAIADAEGRPPRKYYRVTADGKATLQAARKRYPLLAKLAAAGELERA